jgi:hypothetical protein
MAAGPTIARPRKCADLVTFSAGTAVIGVTSRATRAIVGWQRKALEDNSVAISRRPPRDGAITQNARAALVAHSGGRVDVVRFWITSR